jgi:leucyl-tRNA synthetase
MRCSITCSEGRDRGSRASPPRYCANFGRSSPTGIPSISTSGERNTRGSTSRSFWQKISKKEVSSKGGAIPPLFEALAQWGADALRLFYATAAGSSQDIEWTPSLADNAQERLNDIERVVRGTVGEGGPTPELDSWLASEMHLIVQRVNDAFSRFDLREAAELVYVGIPTLLRRASVRAGDVSHVPPRLLDAWIRLMVPITPHLAEELGEGRFSGLVALQPFPSPEEFAYSEVAVARERYLDRVEDDLREVLRPALVRGESVDGVTFFVASPWKRAVEGWVREAFEVGAKGVPVKEVMERAVSHGDVSAHRAEIPKYVARIAPLLRQEPPAEGPALDELSVLRSAEGYLARRFSFGLVQAFPESEAEAHDPMNRRERARPGRPAFYLVGSRPAAKSSARPVP